MGSFTLRAGAPATFGKAAVAASAADGKRTKEQSSLGDCILAELRREGLWVQDRWVSDSSDSDLVIYFARGLHIRVFTSGPRKGLWMFSGPLAEALRRMRLLASDPGSFALPAAAVVRRVVEDLPPEFTQTMVLRRGKSRGRRRIRLQLCGRYRVPQRQASSRARWTGVSPSRRLRPPSMWR